MSVVRLVSALGAASVSVPAVARTPTKVPPKWMTVSTLNTSPYLGRFVPVQDTASRRLGITERTVRKHLAAVYGKAGVRGRAAAAAWWQRLND